jgi:hypothetical protein
MGSRPKEGFYQMVEWLPEEAQIRGEYFVRKSNQMKSSSSYVDDVDSESLRGPW